MITGMATTTDTDAAISRAVWTLLERSGETVVQLSVAVGMSFAACYRKLNGTSTWKASDVAVIAKHYGVTVGDLYSGNPIG